MNSYKGAATGQASNERANGSPNWNGRGRGRGALPIRNHPAPENMTGQQTSGFNRGRGRAAFNQANGRGNSGQPGRGRGRGGYVTVENMNPEADVLNHNPNFKPRPYNTVPPPASLNQPAFQRGRGGRGRGRGQARGGRGRGGAGAGTGAGHADARETAA
ncbi:hypothetical protein FQN49_001501 [Arthroderma sp. PD_2]|nr:hypothetical protein FQN49_001501 [Arthroderma sp. PD_2]